MRRTQSRVGRRAPHRWLVLLGLCSMACVPPVKPAPRGRPSASAPASSTVASAKAAKPPAAGASATTQDGVRPSGTVAESKDGDSDGLFEAFPYDLTVSTAPVAPARLPHRVLRRIDLGANGALTWADDGSIRRLGPNGNLVFSFGFPDAQDVGWSGDRGTITTRAGKTVFSLAGRIIEQPPPPRATAFSADYRFERLADRGQSLESLWNGRVFGIKDGVWSEYGAGAFRPLPGKLTRDGDYHWVEGLLHLPRNRRLALVRNEEPGQGLEQHFIDVNDARAVAVEGFGDIPYEGLVTASSKTRAAWVTLTGIGVSDDQNETDHYDSPGSVLRLHYQGDELWAAGLREHDRQPPQGFAARWNGQGWKYAPCQPPTPVLAIGSTGDTVWLGGDGFLFRCRAEHCSAEASPLTRIGSFWAESPNSLWAAGDGGIARFDGSEWRRIAGVYGSVTSIAGTRQGEVLVATTQGLYRGRRIANPAVSREAGLSVVLTPPAVEPDGASDPSELLRVVEAPNYSVKAFAIPEVGRTRYRPHSMAFVGHQLWLSDGRTTVAFAPGTQAAQVKQRRKSGFDCTRCVALVSGRGVSLLGGELTGAPISMISRRLRSLRPRDGVLWAVADRDPTSIAPQQAVSSPWVPEAQLFAIRARAVEAHVGLPPATYFDLAPSTAPTLWLAGSRSAEPRYRDSLNTAVLDGEGLLVRYDPSRVTQYRFPRGPLLAVDVTPDGGAWAVGVAGQIVTVTDDLRVYEVPRRPWLRAVVARSARDVWVAGDRSTLLHFDGKSWSRIRAKGLTADQSLTALAVGHDGRLWVLGQNVVYRVDEEAP